LVLIDLAVRRPIGVLPDDESAILATWLRGHPGAKISARIVLGFGGICRGRAAGGTQSEGQDKSEHREQQQSRGKHHRCSGTGCAQATPCFDHPPHHRGPAGCLRFLYGEGAFC
jgi:hypothetical protein